MRISIRTILDAVGTRRGKLSRVEEFASSNQRTFELEESIHPITNHSRVCALYGGLGPFWKSLLPTNEGETFAEITTPQTEDGHNGIDMAAASTIDPRNWSTKLPSSPVYVQPFPTGMRIVGTHERAG